VRHAEVVLAAGVLLAQPVREHLRRREPGEAAVGRLADRDEPFDQQLQRAARGRPRERMERVDPVAGEAADQAEVSARELRLLQHLHQRFPNRIGIHVIAFAVVLFFVEEHPLQVTDRPSDAGEAFVELGVDRTL
jgi:hypothetical protein